MKFFFVGFLILIIAAAGVGGYYFYNTSSKSSSLKPFAGQPVTTAPVSIILDINSPEEDSLSFETNIIVSGKTSPNSEVLINSQSKDLVVKSKDDGSFSTLVDLSEGVNNLQITAFDNKGEEKQVDRTVYYSKEKLQ
jgi:hypothetical protein